MRYSPCRFPPSQGHSGWNLETPKKTTRQMRHPRLRDSIISHCAGTNGTEFAKLLTGRYFSPLLQVKIHIFLKNICLGTKYVHVIELYIHTACRIVISTTSNGKTGQFGWWNPFLGFSYLYYCTNEYTYKTIIILANYTDSNVVRAEYTTHVPHRTYILPFTQYFLLLEA